MPLDRRAALQLGVLLMAIPMQFFISRYMETTQAQRSYALKKIVTKAAVFREEYFSWEAWHRWCMELLSRAKTYQTKHTGHADMGESPAVEVLKYRDPHGYFGTSPEPRSPRPPQVKYRIGQVIKHKRWGYRGVIIGWDETARAPDYWLKEMHPPDKPHYSIMVDSNDLPFALYDYMSEDEIVPLMTSEHWKKMPNYSVLVDTRDRIVPQRTYVVEENIQIVGHIRVMHPDMDEYFEGFDGSQYLPRPWLKGLYPHD